MAASDDEYLFINLEIMKEYHVQLYNLEIGEDNNFILKRGNIMAITNYLPNYSGKG